jgi:hypothetical protein
MTNLRIIGAAALSLFFASSAMADSHDGHHHYREASARVSHRMRAQDFNHFDYGIARPTYHSGWGGPYGDGEYPGSVDQNMGNTFN